MVNARFLFPFFVGNFYVFSTLPLPPYIIPCRRDDLQVAECFLEHANAAIPYLIPGDTKYNFPPLNPLKILEASITTANLRLNLSHVSVYGFETTRMINTTIDFTTLTSVEVITMDCLKFTGNYVIEGRILNSPIWGMGVARLMFVKPVFNFTWHMGAHNKNGVQYVDVLDVIMHYDLDRALYHIDNLYDGNSLSGEEMNKKLNANWKALHDEFAPILSTVITKVARRLGENILSIVPLDDIFI